jgi:hypothetical protein
LKFLCFNLNLLKCHNTHLKCMWDNKVTFYDYCYARAPFPSTYLFSSPPDHLISMGMTKSALNFRCQCTQQKLQSICAVLTFDPQLKKILTHTCDRVKSGDLADENNKILTEWKWFETTVLNLVKKIKHCVIIFWSFYVLI